MSSREARAAALKAKKAKLAALKAKHAARTSKSTASKSLQPLPSKTDVNKLVDDILNQPVPGQKPPSLPDTTSTISLPTPTSTSSSTIESTGPTKQEKYAALTLTTSVSIVHIPGKQADMYEKGTQTDIIDDENNGSNTDTTKQQDTNSDESKNTTRGKRSPIQRSRRRSKIETLSNLNDNTNDSNNNNNDNANANDNQTTSLKSNSTSMSSVSKNNDDTNSNNTQDDIFIQNASRVLNEEERLEIEHSDVFTTFLSTSSSVVERILSSSSNFDPTVVYGSMNGEDDVRDESESKVVAIRSYYEEHLCAGRAVTDLAWSPHYNELFLTAMGARDLNTQRKNLYSNEVDSDGMVLVWSLNRHKTPEFKFTCQSPVTTAKFDPFSPNLIVGATFSGQVVLWDKRAKSQPVQRTPLSASGHTHPIFSLEVVGSANANKLVTISTDGRMCSWSLGSLSEPSDSTILSADNKSEVAVTAMSFAAGDSNEFCAGAENGCIYAAQVHGQKSGHLKKYEGHYGPITSVMFHPGSTGGGSSSGSSSGEVNVDDLNALADHSGRAKSLLLSSSVDWTVRLWSHQPRDGQHPLREVANFRSARDYVYDVRWSPVHPGTFAYVDGGGWLHLWDVNSDMEEPVVKMQVTDGCAAVKIRFSSDGLGLIVGDSVGNVHYLNLKKELSSRASAWMKLSQLNQNHL